MSPASVWPGRVLFHNQHITNQCLFGTSRGLSALVHRSVARRNRTSLAEVNGALVKPAFDHLAAVTVDIDQSPGCGPLFCGTAIQVDAISDQVSQIDDAPIKSTMVTQRRDSKLPRPIDLSFFRTTLQLSQLYGGPQGSRET